MQQLRQHSPRVNAVRRRWSLCEDLLHALARAHRAARDCGEVWTSDLMRLGSLDGDGDLHLWRRELETPANWEALFGVPAAAVEETRREELSQARRWAEALIALGLLEWGESRDRYRLTPTGEALITAPDRFARALADRIGLDAGPLWPSRLFPQPQTGDDR